MTTMVAPPEAGRDLNAVVQVLATDGSVLVECASVAEALDTPVSKLDHGDTIVRCGRVLATFHVYADRDPAWFCWWLAPSERAS